jgi:hypothetical protein
MQDADIAREMMKEHGLLEDKIKVLSDSGEVAYEGNSYFLPDGKKLDIYFENESEMSCINEGYKVYRQLPSSKEPWTYTITEVELDRILLRYVLSVKKDSSEEYKSKNMSAPITNNTYNVNQAGAVGPNAHARDMTFNQIVSHVENLDLSRLADELSTLQKAMKAKASNSDSDQDIAIANITLAAKAAKEKDVSKLVNYLKAAGQWALDIATKISVPVAITAITKALGM